MPTLLRNIGWALLIGMPLTVYGLVGAIGLMRVHLPVALLVPGWPAVRALELEGGPGLWSVLAVVQVAYYTVLAATVRWLYSQRGSVFNDILVAAESDVPMPWHRLSILLSCVAYALYATIFFSPPPQSIFPMYAAPAFLLAAVIVAGVAAYVQEKIGWRNFAALALGLFPVVVLGGLSWMFRGL